MESEIVVNAPEETPPAICFIEKGPCCQTAETLKEFSGAVATCLGKCEKFKNLEATEGRDGARTILRKGFDCSNERARVEHENLSFLLQRTNEGNLHQAEL